MSSQSTPPPPSTSFSFFDPLEQKNSSQSTTHAPLHTPSDDSKTSTIDKSHEIQSLSNRHETLTKTPLKPSFKTLVTSTPDRIKPLSSATNHRMTQQISQLSSYYLLMNYKMLANMCPPSMIILPGDSMTFWNGCLFIHSGYFAGGVLNFQLQFPQNFPLDSKMVFCSFDPPLFHPNIHPKTGLLDLSFGFPKWTSEKDKVWHVLHFIRYQFTKLDNLLKKIPINWDWANKNARDLYDSDIDMFKSKISEKLKVHSRSFFSQTSSIKLPVVQFQPKHLQLLRKMLSNIPQDQQSGLNV